MSLVYFNIIAAFLVGPMVYNISPKLWLATVVISSVIVVVNSSLTNRKQKQKESAATAEC